MTENDLNDLVPEHLRTWLRNGTDIWWGRLIDMAWNYERGCDEPKAYPIGSTLYTPPPWKPETIRDVMNWEAAEARVRQYPQGTNIRQEWNEKATLLWKRLEAVVMGWEKNAEIPEFRRRYMEWLAKEAGVEAEIGFVDEVSTEDLPMIERIIWEGFRKLAKTEHPDMGGTTDRFVALKNAKTQLDGILREVREVL